MQGPLYLLAEVILPWPVWRRGTLQHEAGLADLGVVSVAALVDDAFDVLHLGGNLQRTAAVAPYASFTGSPPFILCT